MMKVSDPIIFGHAVRVFFNDLIDKHAATLEELGVDFNNGFGDLARENREPSRRRKKAAIEADSTLPTTTAPPLAMVNSDKGITNLHVPSDVIVDASMPAMIRDLAARCGTPRGKTQDTLAVIPDSSYAGVYQAIIDFCREHGAFDPATMGTVPNVGLMAQKAEEYGSHDKTFEMPADGTVRVTDAGRQNPHSSTRWRPATSGAPARPRTPPIRDWVKLAVNRARATGAPAVFWLDKTRAHDAQLIAKVETYLARPRHRRASTSASCPPPRPHLHSRAHRQAARTPSRSPAMSCATTSPTSSPSSKSAPAPRCSPSSR